MTDQTETFVHFVRPHWKRLHVLALRYTAGDHDARDLVQETLLRAWRNFSVAEDRAYHRGWLMTIMRNIAIEWQRSRQSRLRMLPVANDELTEMVPADPMEPFSSYPSMSEDRFRELVDERIVGALEQLSDPFREVIVLSALGGLNYREVAEVLDCPVGTVMSRMSRARRSLREKLTGYAKSSGWVRENQR